MTVPGPPPPPLPPPWVPLRNQNTSPAPTAALPEGAACTRARWPLPKEPKTDSGSGLQTTWIGTVTLTPMRALGPGNVTDMPGPLTPGGPGAADAVLVTSGIASRGTAIASLAYFVQKFIWIPSQT